MKFIHAEGVWLLQNMAITTDITEAHQARQTLENLAAAIINSTDDAIVSKDLDGIINSWNPAAERIFGYAAGEAIGRSVLMLIPENLADEEPRILQRIRRGEMIDHYQTVRRRKDGSLVDVSLTISPIRDSAGNLIGASKIVRDISEQKRAADALQASELRYRRLYDSIDEGFSVIEILFDEAGRAQDFRYLEVNPAFAKQTGLGDVVGKRVREVVPHIESHWIERYGEVARTRESIRFVDESAALDRWFEVNAFPVDSADRSLVGCLFSDVSERKRHEQALRDADRRKNEFLALLAHELRNPLAPLRNALEILRRTRREWAPEGAAENPSHHATGDMSASESDRTTAILNVMDRQLGQMVRLVDDLLDVSRISRGKIELRPGTIDLSTLIRQATDAARPSCERREQQLTVGLPPDRVWMIGDPARLTQLIGNLIHNASKFTDRGGRIEVILETESHAPTASGAQPHHVLIRVRDNGIGIAADQLERIFQMFTQVDASMVRSSDGLGIGLALVRNLAELHGGTVAVRSAGVGKGSEFVVRLPTEMELPPSEPESASGAEQAGRLAAMRFLVVDDNQDAAESLAALLQLDGHDTHLAHDGLGAVEAAAALQPDVILLDIGLPGLSGYDAARRIRMQQREGARRPLIVALTGWGQEQDRIRSEQAGIDAHLVKPLDYDALMQMLG